MLTESANLQTRSREARRVRPLNGSYIDGVDVTARIHIGSEVIEVHVLRIIPLNCGDINRIDVFGRVHIAQQHAYWNGDIVCDRTIANAN